MKFAKSTLIGTGSVVLAGLNLMQLANKLLKEALMSVIKSRSVRSKYAETLIGSVLVLLAATPCFAESFTFTTLDDPNATAGTWAFGINNSGEIVGQYDDDAGQHGFVYNGSTYTTLAGPPGSNNPAAIGISNSGLIVGTWLDSGGIEHGFLYNGSTYTTLDDPAQSVNTTQPIAVNNSGDVVGGYDGQAFFYNGSSFTTLNDPAAAGNHNFVANGINDSGEISGEYIPAGGGLSGFLYDGSTYTNLAVPGATLTGGQGINNFGQVVGYYAGAVGPEHGFLYDGATWTTLDDPLAASTTIANSVNDSDEIVGVYYDSNSLAHGFLAEESSSTAPEPGTAVMLLSAGMVLGAATIRRRGSRSGFVKPL